MAKKYLDRNADFLLQEHELLRTEIVALIGDIRALERNVLVAVGIVWAFLVRNPPPLGQRWEWYMPPFFVVVGTLRTWGIHKAFIQFSDYLRRTEAEFTTDDGPQGWETFLKTQPRHIATTWVVASAFIFAVTMAVAVFKSRSN